MLDSSAGAELEAKALQLSEEEGEAPSPPVREIERFELASEVESRRPIAKRPDICKRYVLHYSLRYSFLALISHVGLYVERISEEDLVFTWL